MAHQVKQSPDVCLAYLAISIPGLAGALFLLYNEKRRRLSSPPRAGRILVSVFAVLAVSGIVLASVLAVVLTLVLIAVLASVLIVVLIVVAVLVVHLVVHIVVISRHVQYLLEHFMRP